MRGPAAVPGSGHQPLPSPGSAGVCVSEAAVPRVSASTAWAGRAGPAYSVCWLESFTPALGCVRVCVPVGAKRNGVDDPCPRAVKCC